MKSWHGDVRTVAAAGGALLVLVVSAWLAGAQPSPFTLGAQSPGLVVPVATYIGYADAVAFAASPPNKIHLGVFNGVGSGKRLRVWAAYGVNLQTAAVTGVVVRFDIITTSVQSGGSGIATFGAISAEDPAIPGAVIMTTNPVVTKLATLRPFIVSTEEETAVVALSKTSYEQFHNLLVPLGVPPLRPVTLNEGRGLAIQQITSTTVGSYGWLMVFSLE